LSTLPAAESRQVSAANDIQLIVRGDDIGMAQAINEACIKCYREGIERSVEIVVPGPWFLDAVRLLKENPGLDVGVHLTLTCEWDGVKWRPLTAAPTLVDDNGHFHPTTSGFLRAQPRLEDVEQELRAQITLAKKHIPQVSHLSAHMGTATASPALRSLVQRLATEYNLPLEIEAAGRVRWNAGATAAERESTLVDALENLQPGRWLLVEHPGLETPEMRNIQHPGNNDVAAVRAAVTAAFTSPRVQEVIQRRGIKLVSYADLQAK
jgi:predicted glycoside hydrolase/deacetylase ChbG (UPF0249 family)